MNFEGKFEAIGRIENGKKRGNVCREFDLVNSKFQKIWKNRSNIIDAFEQNRKRTKRFRKPERTDVDEALFVRL